MDISLHDEADATIGQRVTIRGDSNLSVADRLRLVSTLRQRRNLREWKQAKALDSTSRYALNFDWFDGGTHDVRESAKN